MNVAIVGTGYVGLVSASCYAETGNHVIAVDIDEAKIDKLRKGNITIYEPGLESIFKRNIEQGRLEFTTDLAYAVRNCQILSLALPTPSDQDGSADLSAILRVANQLSDLITEYRIVVHRSTVPVGTAAKVSGILSSKLDPKLFDVVSNPEFLREGAAVEDFMKPDRVVIGTESEQARDMMSQLYSPFVRQGNPIMFMDARSSEMTKYASNSYLASRISFMNEIANLCEKVGADVDLVRKGMGSDSRIGKRFLFPGVGFGGSCFPKDVRALQKTAIENGYEFQMVDALLKVNQLQWKRMLDKILGFFENELEGKKLAVWGLSFKPNTDDIREAPAVFMINALLEKHATVTVYDPEAIENGKRAMSVDVNFVEDQYEALRNANALLIMTEWSVFRTPDFNMMKEIMNEPVIFDGRNLYSLSVMENEGFYYDSIGRKKISSISRDNG